MHLPSHCLDNTLPAASSRAFSRLLCAVYTFHVDSRLFPAGITDVLGTFLMETQLVRSFHSPVCPSLHPLGSLLFLAVLVVGHHLPPKYLQGMLRMSYVLHCLFR